MHKPRLGTGTLDKMEFFVSFLERCFDGLGVRRITLMVPEERKAARRMAAAAGFLREGTLNDAVSYGGKPQNLAVYGLTRRMWTGV
jgi:RimJ/RimL family protein N-acetyltransferase